MKNPIRIPAVLTLLVLFMASMAANAGQIPDIDHADLVSAVNAKSVVILDVNGSKSFDQGHIPGAIDYIANKERLAELLPADKNALIVAYCSGPKCGAYAAAVRATLKLGYTNVKHYPAGITGWKESGEALESAVK